VCGDSRSYKCYSYLYILLLVIMVERFSTGAKELNDAVLIPIIRNNH
jgi:hypothetical protein